MQTQLTPDTAALPFLVVHGGWFWIVLDVALALVLLGLVEIWRRVDAIVCARRSLARQRAAIVPELVEGRAVVAGRWHRDSITVREERVELGETVRVVLGSRGDHIADDAEVIVSGELARVASARPEPIGYRDNAGTWRIERAEVYAARPRVRPVPLPWVARIVGVLAALFIGHVTLHLVGRQVVERIAEHPSDRGHDHTLQLRELDAIAIAASLPGSRDRALEKLAAALERHPYRDEASVRRQLGLARVRNAECGALRALRARPDEQLALARRCGNHHAVFEILFDLGEYEAAWNSRPPDLAWPYREGLVAIAIGDWAAAAEQAEKMVALNQKEARRPDDVGALHAADALRYRCLAAWFRTLAGEPGAAEQLRQAAQDPVLHPVICAPMVASTLSPDQRVEYLRGVLASLPPADADARFRLIPAERLAGLSLWLEGVRYRGPVGGSMIGIELGNGESALLPWLTPFGVERWRGADDLEQYVLALGGVILREVHRGDFAAARRAAAEAEQAIGASTDTHAQSVVRTWSTFIALRDGQRELPAREYVDEFMDVLKLRRGEAPEHGMVGHPLETCEPLLAAAVSAAQRGDGRPLASAMRACSIDATFGVRALLGVLPLVRQGRHELANVLRWWTDGSGASWQVPFRPLAYAAARRDLARFLGDQESVEHWGHMAERFLAPLEDPTRTLALILWQQ